MANVQIGSKPDVLYVLTISGDLADYYDGERGEGAFDALTPDQQYNLAKRVSVAIESGCQESIAVAFEFGLEDFDDSQNWPKLICGQGCCVGVKNKEGRWRDDTH